MKRTPINLSAMLLLGFFVVTGCNGKDQEQKSVPASATIGTAKMLKSGTIVVRLHGESAGRMREIKYELKPDNPGYKAFKFNIGGIAPGEEKPIFSPPEPKCLPPSIGSARMLQDGTLVLHLRGETNGMIAEMQYEVKPDDPKYKSTLEHIGDIKPGEVKLVPPWPDGHKGNAKCVDTSASAGTK